MLFKKSLSKLRMYRTPPNPTLVGYLAYMVSNVFYGAVPPLPSIFIYMVFKFTFANAPSQSKYIYVNLELVNVTCTIGVVDNPPAIP